MGSHTPRSRPGARSRAASERIFAYGEIPVHSLTIPLLCPFTFGDPYTHRTHSNAERLNMGSHTPPEDLKARFQGVGCGYIHMEWQIVYQVILCSQPYAC